MKRPLDISTYDGSGQAVHPDVLHLPEGFLGSTYWMAMTPYAWGDDRLENPSLRVSSDGVRWVEPLGTPDPVVPAPEQPSRHNADPELAVAGERLYLTYIEVDKDVRVTRLLQASSIDARTWDGPAELRVARFLVSPTFAQRDDQWHLWCVTESPDAGRTRVELATGPNPGEMSGSTICEVRVPGHVVWHIDAIATDEGFEMLVAAYPRWANNSRTALFHFASKDGVRFRRTRARPVLRPIRRSWANRAIYRSTFVKCGTEYRIWFSAASWDWRWGIGMVEGPLDRLRPVGEPEENIGRDLLRQEAVGRLRYLYTRWRLHRVSGLLRRGRR